MHADQKLNLIIKKKK